MYHFNPLIPPQMSDAARGKLDVMMGLCLDLARSFLVDQDQDNAAAFFFFLWSEFHLQILPTHQAKHVQFLLFYACRCHMHTFMTFMRLCACVLVCLCACVLVHDTAVLTVCP